MLRKPQIIIWYLKRAIFDALGSENLQTTRFNMVYTDWQCVFCNCKSNEFFSIKSFIQTINYICVRKKCASFKYVLCPSLLFCFAYWQASSNNLRQFNWIFKFVWIVCDAIDVIKTKWIMVLSIHRKVAK